MAGVLSESLALLEKKATYHDSILVAYSGGKDSLAVLDLCHRCFARVVCFFAYQVPGLEVIEKQMRFARERYGVEVVQYPHWRLADDIKGGVYCHPASGQESMKAYSQIDFFKMVRRDVGVELLATGGRVSDFLNRRATIRKNTDQAIIFPIAEWHTTEVIAYLKMRGIPLPEAHCDSGGVDLTVDSLLWLHDKHPEDFKRMAAWFPFIWAVPKRRELYGIPATKK